MDANSQFQRVTRLFIVEAGLSAALQIAWRIQSIVKNGPLDETMSSGCRSLGAMNMRIAGRGILEISQIWVSSRVRCSRSTSLSIR